MCQEYHQPPEVCWNTLSQIASLIYDDPRLFASELRKDWGHLCSEPDGDHFALCYMYYLHNPYTLYRQEPQLYHFLKEHLFRGRVYLDSADEQQIVKSVSLLRKVSALQPEVWVTLDLNERLAALQLVERLMAAVQGRPPVDVVAVSLRPGLYGYFDQEAIHISEWGLSSDDVAEAVDTIIHEGRHAYQHYAVDHPGFHPNQKQVDEWQDNFENYLTAALYGQEAYAKQPVETDAWAFAGRVRKLLYGEED